MDVVVKTRPELRNQSSWLRLILIATVLFLTAQAGIGGMVGGSHVPALWLANAAAVGIILRSPRSQASVLWLATCAGLVTANVVTGDYGALSFALTCCNLVEIGIAVAILRAADRDAEAGVSVPFLLRILVGSLLAPAVSGVFATAILALRLGAPVLPIVASWYGAHSLGLLMVAPLILSVRRSDLADLVRLSSGGQTPAIVALAGVVTALVFSAVERPLLFMVLPPLFLAAFRLRFAFAAMALVVVGLIATTLTVLRYGPITHNFPYALERIWANQIFLAVVTVLVLSIAAILADRERLVAQLRAGERRYRSLAEASPTGMFRTDTDGRILFGTPQWRSLLGLAPNECVGHWTESVADDARAGARAAWREAVHAGTLFAADYEFELADDEIAWRSVSLVPERDADDAIVGWAGSLVDIEDRVSAREQMTVSERLHRLLAEHSNDMIVRAGLGGAPRYVSPACRNLLGFEPEEMIDAEPGSRVHPGDRLALAGAWNALLAGEDDIVCAYRERNKAGDYVWLEASLSLVTDPATGAPIEVIASVRDIGKRRAAEEAIAAATQRLEESHRLLTMAEQLAGIGHWRVVSGTGVVICSRQVFRIYGIEDNSSMPLSKGLSFYHPDDRQMVVDRLDAAAKDGSSFSISARLIRPSGALRHVLSQGQAEFAPDGTILGVFGVIQDVTGDVQAQAELIAARDQARDAAEAKSAFLAMMSHEIRTPMTGVLGMIDLLRLGPPPEERARYFDSLQSSAKLLMKVLDDVLDYSKIESGQLSIESVDFDMRDLTRTALDLFHNAASRKGLRVTLDLAVDPDRMIRRGDPIRIQQVVSNLLSNAIKFTDTGEIALRIGSDTRAPDRWRFEAIDTGIGIPAETIGKLFQPFVQADLSTTRRFGGTGLGLTISRRLVEAMGGRMGVSSEPGVGSTFWFEIDLPEGHADAMQQIEILRGPGRPLAVLLTEDNEINKLLVSSLLRRMGHDVTCVENGRLAVAAIQGRAFDVVLMDIQMPEMDGLTATREIRALGGRFADLPIVALTADASAERRRFDETAGFTDFLAKPVDAFALERTLATLGNRTGEDPPVPETVVLSEERLTDLRRVVGRDVVARMLGMLVEEVQARPGLIRSLLSQDIDRVRAEAHGLKGAASSMGAVRLADAAAAIETAAPADLAAAVDRLDAAAAATLAAIAPTLAAAS